MGWIIRQVAGIPDDLPAARVNVAIDVIRAFTTTEVALDAGATRVVLVARVDQARQLRDPPKTLIAGERDAIKLDGFDLGNSPAELAEADLDGRELVLTTTNGVPAALAAMGAEHVFVCGLSGARALADHLRRSVEPGLVHLICSRADSDEDFACTDYLAALLEAGDAPVDPAPFITRVRRSQAAQKFLDPDQPGFDARDIDRAAVVDGPGFVMPVGEVDGRLVVRRLDQSSSHRASR